MASFASRLVDAVRSKGNPVCVGLDPRLGSLPEACLESSQDLEAQARAYAKFCCQIIDVVAPMQNVWDVLTDYENLDKVVPSLVQNDVLQRYEACFCDGC